MCGDILPYSIPSVKTQSTHHFRSNCRRPVWPLPSELRFRFGFRSASSPRTRDAGRNLNGRSSLRSIRPALVRPSMTITPTSLTPRAVRQACRDGSWNYPSTAGICEGYVQANLVILPSKYADDFRNLCARNPVPCPLLGETKRGDPTIPSHLAADCDIRTDAPLYRIYKGGKLVEEKKDILAEWDDDDSVGFLIGCSFSFEAALINGGLTPRQIEIGRNVPMYRTKTPLAPAGRE